MTTLETAILCLALNVYHEARDQPIEGQYAVALVTMNRAEHDHEKVCTEVFRYKQFSWTIKRAYRSKKNTYKLNYLGIPRESLAWESSVRVATNTLFGKVDDFTNGATHYHADYVSPKWSRVLEYIGQIETHIFYR